MVDSIGGLNWQIQILDSIGGFKWRIQMVVFKW